MTKKYSTGGAIITLSARVRHFTTVCQDGAVLTQPRYRSECLFIFTEQLRPEATAEHVSQFFVFLTCAAIDLSFSHYYSIKLKSLLLNLRDRRKSF